MRNQVEGEDPQLRVLKELCSIISNTLKFPPLPFFPFLTSYPHSSAAAASSSSSSSVTLTHSERQPWWTSSQGSVAAFGSLFLVISMALMLFGLAIFLIGLLLLPCVTVLVLLLYSAALLSQLFRIGSSFRVLFHHFAHTC